MSFTKCGTKSLETSQSTSIEKQTCEVSKAYDSFYLTECSWANKVFEDKTENYLISLDEVVAALRDCHARHNPLVRQLK